MHHLKQSQQHRNGCALNVISALQAFTRGILCNWLVCLAVWQANAAQTLGGKFIVSLTQV